MKARSSACSRFAVSVALLLFFLPAGARPAAVESHPGASDSLATRALGLAWQAGGPIARADAHVADVERASADVDPDRLRSAASADVDQASADIGHASDARTSFIVTKSVTPTQQVTYGDALTYTLVVSAAPGVQVGLYDPLTGTTFTRFVKQPGTGTITHSNGIVTGTLIITPTHQITASFVVQVDAPGTLGHADPITNRACIYPFGGTLGGCVWSNEATTLLTHNVYLPLVVRNYEQTRAAFIAAPTSGPVPLTVVFTNTSTGAYTAPLWHFGDGITSTQTSPTHTYTSVGTYTPTLTVRGPRVGGTSTLSRPNYITVTPSHMCIEGVVNGGFEVEGDWELPITPYSADYTTATFHSGCQAMRTGIVEPAHNRESYSSARQAVAIPADAVSATLRFWLYPMSGEPLANVAPPAHPPASRIEEVAMPGDSQYVLVLNQYGQWINTLVWQRRNDRTWMAHQVDMGIYAGRTVQLHFGVYNDGWCGITAMYVDDVSLEICTPAACWRQDVGD